MGTPLNGDTPDPAAEAGSALERLRARTAALRAAAASPAATDVPAVSDAGSEATRAATPAGAATRLDLVPAQPPAAPPSLPPPAPPPAPPPPPPAPPAVATVPAFPPVTPVAPATPAAGEPAPEPADTQRGSGRRALTALSAAAVVLAAALVALVLVGLLPQRRDTEHDNAHAELIAQVAAAARQQSVNYLTFNYHDVSAYTATVAANSVGVFHTQSVNAATQVERSAVADHSISSAAVRDVAVVSATPTVSSALVIVDNPVTNKADPSGRVNHYRLQLDMQFVHGKWLLSDITTVS